MNLARIKKTLRLEKSSKPKEGTRNEMKRKLDYFASGQATLLDIQSSLQQGNRRHLEINEEKIFVVVEESKSKFNWQVSDPRTAVACLAVLGEYEILETKILKYFASKAKYILDVGANVGYYSVELGKVLASDAKLLAFEPIPESFTQLKYNVELNSLGSKILIHQLAISDSEGQIELYIPAVSGSSASSARNLHPTEPYDKIQVTTTCLDAFYRDYGLSGCDLIKVDVEGAELMVIRGALNTIKTHSPIIFAELLRKWSTVFGYSPNEVISILKPLGYRCFGVSQDFPEVNEVTEDTRETNFIFVPSNRISDIRDLFKILKGK